MVFAGACGLAVYRTGETRPVFRALVTFGCLLVTPVVVFVLLSTVLTSNLPIIIAILPIVLLGTGLYIIAEGTSPRSLLRRNLAG